MSLGDHLRSRVRYVRGRVRSGLALRHSRHWACEPDARIRLHRGIRKGLREYRKLSGFLAEYRALRSHP